MVRHVSEDHFLTVGRSWLAPWSRPFYSQRSSRSRRARIACRSTSERSISFVRIRLAHEAGVSGIQSFQKTIHMLFVEASGAIPLGFECLQTSLDLRAGKPRAR